jgi:PilZ domain
MPHSPNKPFGVPNPAAPAFRPPGASKVSPARERRRRPRVLLELPGRIRWLGPFGLETEITRTQNVSRDGLLVSSARTRQAGSLLWATFPYDAAVPFTESETPGKVVRCVAESAATHLTAIAFHQVDPLFADLAIALSDSSRRADRRRHPRISLAFVVRIERIARNSQSPQPETESSPWPEEAMTVDVSPDGMVFCTLRIYEVGERIIVVTQPGRKLSGGERRARVVRVVRPHSDSPLSHVAVEFLS